MTSDERNLLIAIGFAVEHLLHEKILETGCQCGVNPRGGPHTNPECKAGIAHNDLLDRLRVAVINSNSSTKP